MRKDYKEKVDKITKALIKSDFNAIKTKMKNKEGVILKMEKEKIEKETNKKANILKFAWVPALAATAFTIFLVSEIGNSNLTTVTIDVNPTMELKVNDNNKVKEVNALDNDAKELLKELDLKNDDLEEATDKIMDKLIENNYISAEKNSVLVTTAGENAEKVKSELSDDIQDYLKSKNIVASVLSQIVESNDELEKIAKEHDISLGLAKLINEMYQKNPNYDIVELAKLTMFELNSILGDDIDELDDLEIKGDINLIDFIGVEGTLRVIMSDLNISSESKISNYEVDLDYNNKKLVYEVEFEYENAEYEYELDAYTGEIISKKLDSKDINDDQNDDDNDDDQNDNDNDNDDNRNNNDDDDQDDDNDNDDQDDDDQDDDDNDNDDQDGDDND